MSKKKSRPRTPSPPVAAAVSSDAPRGRWWVALLPPLAIALLVRLAYSGVGGHEFVAWDDGRYIAENKRVLEGLTWDNVAWALTTGEFSNWHPLMWLSLMLDVNLFDGRPGPMHVVNAVLHLANSLLLYGLLLRMTGYRCRSMLVAMLFAVHPLHVESVAWISERKDVLSTLFWLLATWAYVRYTERRTFARYTLVLLGLALGLMSKPMLVTMPFTLLLLDYWPLGRMLNAECLMLNEGKRQQALSIPHSSLSISRLVIEKAPMFVLVVASSVATLWAQGQGGALQSFDKVSLDVRLANTAQAYLKYLGQMFWPQGLSPLYPLAMPEDARPRFLLLGLLAAVVLVAITVVCLRLRRQKPYLAVGWLWYLGTLVPVIGLVQVGAQSMADRYTYVPLIGIFVALVWLVGDLAAGRRAAQIGLIAVAVLIVAGCVMLTRQQAAYWRDSVTLFRHALRVTPDNQICQVQLANLLASKHEFKEAEQLYQALLKTHPELPEVHYNYGVMLMMFAPPGQPRAAEAEREFREALRLYPTQKRNLFKLNTLQEKLSRALALQQKYAEALPFMRAAVQADPQNMAARKNLVRLLGELGERREAREQLEMVLKAYPEDAEARELLEMLRRPS